MKPFLRLIPLALIGASCSKAPPVATYGPPPPVTEPTPTASEEFALIVGDEMTAQEQEDLAAIQTTVYVPPPEAAPPTLDAGLDEILNEQGAELIEETIDYDIPIVLNERVEWWVRYFTQRIPDSFERYLIRSGAWLPYLKERLRSAGLPEDLAYLVLIESGFSTHARSRVGAVGPWQFMSYTGREYGLRIDGWVDERRDYERATAAAIAYLTDLHDMFGSWYLAAASYNGGQGRVGRAVVRANTTNFWELTNLREETKNYVPKLIAATIIAKQPEKHGFGGIRYSEPNSWATVVVPTSTDLEIVAESAESSLDEIRDLNPHLVRDRTPPNEENFAVRIPDGAVEIFHKNYALVPPDERTTAPREHIVQRGETLGEIAGMYGVSVRDLMSENGIRDPRRLQIGQRLYLSGAAGGGSAGRVSQVASAETHQVQRGQTLYGIARRYGVSVADLKSANGLTTDTIQPGMRLSIP